MTFLTSRRGGTLLAATTALVILAVAALPVTASSWSTPKRLAGPGTVWSNGVATEGNNVVVSWLENASQLVYRVSTDKGKTFGATVNVGGSYTPATVTLCGGLVAAVRGIHATGDMVLDLRSIDGTLVESRTLATGRDLSATGNGATCVGGRRLATFWDEWIDGALRLKVAVVPLVEPLASYEFDVGKAYLYRVRGITATDTHIWMAWSRTDGIMVQRFNVAADAAMKVTRGVRTHVAPNVFAPGVSIAAVGKRVYIGYEIGDKALVRISKDGGRSFGRAQTLFTSANGDEASAWSLAARENVVAASVHVGPWCGGCVGSNRSIFSTNWGRSWVIGPENSGGYMPQVALIGAGAGIRIAQAWDNRTSHETSGDPGYLKFQLGTP